MHNAAMTDRATQPLALWQKMGLMALAVLMLGFGGLVVYRTAYARTRINDVQVFFRAAWAVRTGHDPYTTPDDHGWHYLYPPLLAIVLEPLADAPPGHSRQGLLPFGVSVGIWYGLALGMTFLAAHVLADAVERTSSDPAWRGQPRFCRRWWALRLVAVLACLPALGRSLMRGQVGALILLLLCLMGAELLRGRRFRAGLWLAGAICIKVIPGLLLLAPLWRRDFKMLSGAGAGLLLGLVLVPVLTLGPARSWDCYRSLERQVIAPGLAGDTGGTTGQELTGVTSTDTNSPMAVIHAWLHPVRRGERPKQAAPAVRAIHWVLAAILIAVTLAAIPHRWRARQQQKEHLKGKHLKGTHLIISRGNGAKEIGASPLDRSPLDRPRPQGPPEARGDALAPLPHGRGPSHACDARGDVMLLAALSLVAIIISPVFHPHYFAHAVFPVLLLVAWAWERGGYFRMGWPLRCLLLFIFVVHLVTAAVAEDQSLWFLRDFGLVLAAALWLWWACVAALRTGYARADDGPAQVQIN
jgi:hypothetical protein